MLLETLVVSPFGTNCYLLGCPDTRQGAVIDPGDGADQILETATSMGVTIATIVLTHGHADHVAATGEVKDATGADVVSHAADTFLLGAAAEQAAAFGWFVSTPVPPPDRTVDEGDRIQVGNLAFDVLHTPGHSPGGISLKGDEAVFVGDLLFAGSIGRTDLPGGSTEQLLRAVREKIFTLPGDTVLYTGHGPSTTVEREQSSNPFFQAHGGLFA